MLIPQKQSITFDQLASLATKKAICSNSSNNNNQQHNIRSDVLNLAANVGVLCSKTLQYAPLDTSKDTSFWDKTILTEATDTTVIPNDKICGKTEIAKAMANIFISVFVLTSLCNLDLRVSILKKMKLNSLKYPKELCKGESGKYTEYSDHTGITKTEGQSTLDFDMDEFMMSTNSGDSNTDKPQSYEKPCSTVREMTKFIRNFAAERDWEKHHSPRNIVLAMFGEAGELAELFQWRSDGEEKLDVLNKWTREDIDKVSQELADVAIYLIRLSDVCNIDLGQITMSSLST